MSPGLKSGLIAALTVSARSKAEIPVVIFLQDSIETVNAVVFFFPIIRVH